MYDEQEPPSRTFDWPDTWGKDPVVSRSNDSAYTGLVSKGLAELKKAKDPEKWEAYWRESPRWEHGEECSMALLALDDCLYRATNNSQVHLDSLIRGFEEGLFPAHPIAPWKERWMRDKLVSFVSEAKPGTSQAKLGELILDRWPWAFAWAGQGSQNFRHPLMLATRAGNYAFAERMMDTIPANEWLDWHNPYDLRSIWMGAHWRQGDVSWFNKVADYDPRILAINHKEGMGPLEMAAKSGNAEVVDKLLAQGMQPDPALSFGMTLAHWTVMGLSHSKWNHRRGEFDPKSPEEIERDAIACGKTLAVLSRHGHGMDAPVQKIKPPAGVRRKPKLPKPPETAAQFLERKREESLLSDTTIAFVQQAYMQEGALAVPAPSGKGAGRPRL